MTQRTGFWYIGGKWVNEKFIVWHYDNRLYNTGTSHVATEEQAIKLIKPNGMIVKETWSDEKGFDQQFRSYGPDCLPYCDKPFN